ncbi:alpha/beta fold hydrolase [Streptomyces sp. NPDC050504]|uniref:alpha/beta fold hydrolase n=1 Tax=Streptomyces sp. NPDC050504 TaxID=3365618 RepID=UPI0037BB9AE1
MAVRMLLPPLRHDLEVVSAAGWRLGPVTAPVHLLGGELDPAVPPAAVRELAARLGPRSLRFVPGGAHMYVVEHPAETADALRDLWRERERAAEHTYDVHDNTHDRASRPLLAEERR